jgi:hypothetical protein
MDVPVTCSGNPKWAVEDLRYLTSCLLDELTAAGELGKHIPGASFYRLLGVRRGGKDAMDHLWLSEAQFAKIAKTAPHLPTDTRGTERVDDRRVISGIVAASYMC